MNIKTSSSLPSLRFRLTFSIISSVILLTAALSLYLQCMEYRIYPGQMMSCPGTVIISLCCAILTGVLLSRYLCNTIITLPHKALQEYIECLKGSPATQCPIPSSIASAEIQILASGISDLQDMRVSATHSDTMQRSSRVHSQMVSGLLSLLKQRLTTDYSLLDSMNDYALLLQMECSDILPPPRQFDIARILDAALISVRNAGLVSEKLHLMTSLKRNMPKRWNGQPELVEGLLRHLLVIALHRTRRGLVRLRIENDAQSIAGDEAILRIVIEDSGAHLQRGQLEDLLLHEQSEIPANMMPHAISWKLVSWLTHCMKGHSIAESPTAGGLKITISLPLALPLTTEEPTPILQLVKPLHLQPLVLAIEDHSESRDTLTRQFTQAGARVFATDNYEQAVEWAIILPFSAILINTRLTDAKKSIARQLFQTRDSYSDIKMSIWAVITDRSFVEFDYWRQAGVTALLLKPLYQDELQRMCMQLPAPDPLFYHHQSPLVLADFPPSIAVQLPQLNHALAIQLSAFEEMLRMMEESPAPPDAAERAHAVRSAALSLGYMRLAALMGAIEHAIATRGFDSVPHNWITIADSIKATKFSSL